MMEEWRPTTLRDLLKAEHGYAFKGEYFSDSGHYVLLTPGNFHEEGGFKLRPGKDRFYVGEIPDRYILPKGSMIVAMTEQAEGLLVGHLTIR
jgi:type I restriction enzyme, S subunit